MESPPKFFTWSTTQQAGILSVYLVKLLIINTLASFSQRTALFVPMSTESRPAPAKVLDSYGFFQLCSESITELMSSLCLSRLKYGHVGISMRVSFKIALSLALFVVTSGAWAGNITVLDNDFTSPSCGAPASGATCAPTVGTWTVVAGAGQLDYTSSQYTAPPDASTQVGWANFATGGELTQVVTTLGANTTYVLSVEVGGRTTGTSFDPIVELFAGPTLIGTATGTLPAAGTWQLYTLTVDSASLSGSLLGDPVEIVLTAGVSQSGFSHVGLNATSDVPEPAMFAL